MNKIKFYIVLITILAGSISLADEVNLSETEDLFSSTDNEANTLSDIQNQDPSKVIVTVNEDKITLGEIQKEMSAQLQRFGGQISAEQYSTIEQQLFEDVKNRIINNKLLLNAIKSEGITVSDDEIDKEINNIRSSLPEGTTLEELLAAQGASIENIQNDIQQQIAIAQIANLKTANVPEVTDIQDEEFYIQNP